MCSPWCAAFSRAAKLRVRQVIVGRHCNARCQHTGQDFRDVVSHKETTIVGALCDVSFVVEKLDHSPTAPSMWNNSSGNDVLNEFIDPFGHQSSAGLHHFCWKVTRAGASATCQPFEDVPILVHGEVDHREHLGKVFWQRCVALLWDWDMLKEFTDEDLHKVGFPAFRFLLRVCSQVAVFHLDTW